MCLSFDTAPNAHDIKWYCGFIHPKLLSNNELFPCQKVCTIFITIDLLCVISIVIKLVIMWRKRSFR